MESKFHENSVITGVADSFCLSCQKYLKLKDIELHIAEPAHRDTLQSTAYVEKYEKDRIRKVPFGYYCEVCNLMFQTLAKTKIHINEVAHINNKNKQLLNKSDEGVIAFDDILIEKNSWHGLAEGSCLVCNTEYSNENDHMNDQIHILNLIQSKFELSENEYVYRKIDEDSYNCLVCNIIISKDSKSSHFNEPDHKKNYVICQENKRRLTNSEKQTDAHDGVNKVKYGESNEDLKKSEVDSENIKSETQIACHNNEANNKINDKDDDELLHPAEALKRAKEYAKQNNLTYKRNGTYCKYCDVKFSSSLKMMKEHVEESSHKEKAQIKIGKKLTKMPTISFIKSDFSAKNLLFHDLIINNEICISASSFMVMIHTHMGRLRCHLCDETIDSREIDEHRNTLKHAQAILFAPVITDFETEFVREIRPNLYHCGYCNLIVSSLVCLEMHLMSVNHNEKKSAAKLRLQKYLMDITVEKMFHQMRNFQI